MLFVSNLLRALLTGAWLNKTSALHKKLPKFLWDPHVMEAVFSNSLPFLSIWFPFKLPELLIFKQVF